MEGEGLVRRMGGIGDVVLGLWVGGMMVEGGKGDERCESMVKWDVMKVFLGGRMVRLGGLVVS